MSQYPELLIFEGKFTFCLFAKNVGFRGVFLCGEVGCYRAFWVRINLFVSGLPGVCNLEIPIRKASILLVPRNGLIFPLPATVFFIKKIFL
jgi:hypothetical protein